MNEWTSKLSESVFLLREFRICYLSTWSLAYWSRKSLRKQQRPGGHSDLAPALLFPTLLLFFLGADPRTLLWEVSSLNQEERARISGNKRTTRKIQTGPLSFPQFITITSYSLTCHVPPWLPTPHKIFRSNCLLGSSFPYKVCSLM